MVLAFWWGGPNAAGAMAAHNAGLVREDVLSDWLRDMLAGKSVQMNVDCKVGGRAAELWREVGSMVM